MHAQDDPNLRILHKFEGTFSLDTVQMFCACYIMAKIPGTCFTELCRVVFEVGN